MMKTIFSIVLCACPLLCLAQSPVSNVRVEPSGNVVTVRYNLDLSGSDDKAITNVKPHLNVGKHPARLRKEAQGDVGTVKNSGEKQITFELSGEDGGEQNGDLSFAMEWNGGNKGEYARRFRFGVTAGLNTYGFNGDMFGPMVNPPTKMRFVGFQVGVLANYAFSKRFSITPELLFTQRGERYGFFHYTAYYQQETISEVRYTLNYLHLPINITYNSAFSATHKILVFTGVYFGLGINIITRISTKLGEDKVDDGPKFGSEESDFKRGDLGWNIGVGYQYKKVFLKGQLNYGMVDLLNYSDGKYARNNNVAITLGYLF
jgi:hypothetical protein